MWDYTVALSYHFLLISFSLFRVCLLPSLFSLPSHFSSVTLSRSPSLSPSGAAAGLASSTPLPSSISATATTVFTPPCLLFPPPTSASMQPVYASKMTLTGYVTGKSLCFSRTTQFRLVISTACSLTRGCRPLGLRSSSSAGTPWCVTIRGPAPSLPVLLYRSRVNNSPPRSFPAISTRREVVQEQTRWRNTIPTQTHGAWSAKPRGGDTVASALRLSAFSTWSVDSKSAAALACEREKQRKKRKRKWKEE